MVGAGEGLPDWRDAADYRALLGAAPEMLAWEWLRRDPGYAAAARAAPRRVRALPEVTAADPAACGWGLHAFEDPRLPAALARPVWRRERAAGVLVAEAVAGGPAGDCLDLARFPQLLTVVRAAVGPEHGLLCDGKACLRLDLLSGSLLAGPSVLTFRLAGVAALRAPLDTLHRLLRFARTGRLPPPAHRSRSRRLVLLLRARDALADGATHRDIAAALLSGEAAGERWRSAAPSLRSQAQRLALGARAMAAGGWRSLLGD